MKLKRIGRDLWLWALYDFADSFGFIGLTFYFGLWFIADLHGSDLWMSGAVALSTIALFLTLPFLGHLSDVMRRRIPFLMAMALLCIVTLFALGIVGGRVHSLNTQTTLIVIFLYFLFQFFYQAAFTFYNAFLRDLANEDRSVEKVSGFGSGLGQIGNLVGLIVLFPIAQGGFSLFGATGKPAVFIAAAVLFFIFSLPVFLFLREQGGGRPIDNNAGVMKTMRETIRDFRAIRRYPGVLAYIVTYYLFADAVLTLTLFVTLYLRVIGHFDNAHMNVILVIGAFFTMIGAYTSHLFVRLLGGRKRAITVFICLWTVFITAFALATSPVIFAIVVLLNGFAYGVLFSLSRSFYAILVPAEKQAEFFSVYVLFERAASILGPLVWSGMALAFASFGADRYRFSMFSLAIIVATSLISFQWVEEPRVDH